MKTIFVNLLFAVLLLFPTLAEAQLDDVEGSEEVGLDVAPAQTDAPIDGGLSILLVAGAAYGAKKVAESRKKNGTLPKEK